MDLKKIRKQIDKVDTKIIKAFQKRMEIVDEVTKYKIAHNMDVLDSSREKMVIDKATKKVENPHIKSFVPSLYSTIMGISRRYQTSLIKKYYEASETYKAQLVKNPKVGCLGIKGSFSHQAVGEYFEEVEQISFESFDKVVEAVLKGEIDYGILPVENTSTGNVDASIDLLAQKNVWILDEYILNVRHNLLGIKGTKEKDIKRVYSHQQPIRQCNEYLENNKISASITQSTAHGAKKALEENSTECGAIASHLCAKLYDMEILKEDIQSNQHNYTRFVVVAKGKHMLVGANKISIVATLNHRAGALYELLELFASHSVNLLKIVSRPIANNPWEYNFHLDFSGNLEDENIVDALAMAKNICVDVKVLGCYRAYERVN